MQVISLPAENLLAFQEELSSMEGISYLIYYSAGVCEVLLYPNT